MQRLRIRRGHAAVWRPTAAGLAGVFLPFLASRMLLLVCGVLALQYLPLKVGDGPWAGSPTAPWLASLSRWDGRWYLSIVQDGYTFQPGAMSSVAFAPLFPVLIKIGALVSGRNSADDLLAIGVLVANACLFIALLYLRLLSQRFGGHGLGLRTTLCLVAFPMSFFLSAVYPHALFLALTTAAFYYAYGGNWRLAGLLGGLAALTRVPGALILVPLAYRYATQPRRPAGPQFLWLALIPAAIGAWSLYEYLVFGDPFLMFRAAHAWGREFTWPWDTLDRFFSVPISFDDAHSAIDLAFAVLYVLLAAGAWRLLDRTLGLFAVVMLLPAVSSALLSSIPRFGLEVFPLFLVLGQVTKRSVILAGYLVVAGVLSFFFMGAFALGWWVA